MGVVAQSSTVREVSKRATTMEKERKTFVFHKEWYDAIAPLDGKTRCEVYEAIMHHVWELGDISLSPLAEMAMRFIRPQIVQDTDKWLDIKMKRSSAGSKHHGNQYTTPLEQNGTNGTNGTSVPTLEQNGTSWNKLEQNGTNGSVYVLYEDNNNIISMNNNNKNKKEEKDINISTKKIRHPNKYTDDFEQAFKATGRKGSKANAFKRWQMLSDEDKVKAVKHIPFYYKSNDRQYLKDFEGYLNGRYFENVVYDRKGEIVYDPERETAMASSYAPMTGIELRWSDKFNCYLYMGESWNPNPTIYDGYKDEDRPDGATIMLNNARGTVKWNKQQNKWEKI